MSQTKLIMIDDTDSGISYTGNWIADKGSVDNLGNYGAPYESTNHYTTGTGSFTYTFSGTYVGVFGTTVDGTNPNRQCTVDGTVIPNNDLTAAENGVMHCQVNGLADGKHTLVVTVPTANPSGYWFDYLMYIPSASVSTTNAALTYINGDPSMNFGTGWSQGGPGYIATSNGATFNMQFTGRSLTWYGFYLSQYAFAATTATYSIDGGSPVTFNLNGIASQRTGAEFNQIFFETGVISAGQHNIKVVYNGNSGTTPLSIYNLIVQNGNSAGVSVGPVAGGGSSGSGSSGVVSAPTVTVTTGGSSSASSTLSVAGGTLSIPTQSSVVVIGTGASAITVTVAANSTQTQAPGGLGGSTTTTSPGSTSTSSSSGSSGTTANGSADNLNSTSSSHSHVGAIVGALIGVIALLLLLILLFFLRRRKRRAAKKSNTADTSIAQPFTDPPSSPSMQQRSMAVVSPAGFSDQSTGHYAPVPYVGGRMYSDEKRQLFSGPSHAHNTSLSTFSSPSSASNHPDSSDIVMLHEDSGVRLPPPGDRPGPKIVEMPPTYSAS